MMCIHTYMLKYTYAHTHTQACMDVHTSNHISQIQPLNVTHTSRDTQQHTLPQGEDTLCYGLGCVCVPGIYYQGFGLGSVYRVSVGRTCAGSQMTLWSDEDLIREKPDSLTQVFFVLLASDACWRPQLNDEKRSARMDGRN